jgi:hypothetical protein
VSFRPYTDEYKARFAELAELFFECRQAFRDVAASTNWRPAPKSPAADDIRKLVEHDPAYPQTVAPKISMVLYFYLYAASEHLGSLGALYTMQEVLISPGVLLRCVLEHCAVSMWVLQRGDGALEDRLARAYLEELASAEEAKKTSGRLLGKTASQHQDQAAQFEALREEAELIFGEPPFDDKGRASIRDQHRLGPTETVVWMLGFMSQPRAKTEAAGVYDYLSNLSHPTLYPHYQLWMRADDGGEIHSTMNLDAHEKQVRLAVIPYYETLTYVMSYHGWPPAPQERLTAAMERVLPGVFVASEKI